MQRDSRSSRISQEITEIILLRHRIGVSDYESMKERRIAIDKGIRGLRSGRRSIIRQVYHITTVTKDRAPRFLSLLDARCVIRAMKRIQESRIADTWAFVVMPDHVHWILQLRQQSTLSACVGSMKSQSAMFLRKARISRETIWQRGFHDRAIRRNDDLVAIARYLVANPLRAGLVSSIGDYPHWDSVWL